MSCLLLNENANTYTKANKYIFHSISRQTKNQAGRNQEGIRKEERKEGNMERRRGKGKERRSRKGKKKRETEGKKKKEEK